MKKIFSHPSLMRFTLLRFTLTFFFGVASASASYATRYESYRSFSALPVSLNLDLEYYKTAANFDAGGNRESLSSGNSFQDIDLAAQMRWQFYELALIGGFNIGNSESNDPAFTRKNSVINRIDLASEYLFMSDIWFRFFGRLSYGHSLEKIDYLGDKVLSSDGAYALSPELILNLDFEDGLYSFLKVGLILRGEGLSALGTYGVGLESRFSSYAVGASLLGSLTLKEDSHTQNPGYRDNLNNAVNGGSKIFNSINPSQHNLEVNFNFLMNNQSFLKFYTGYNLFGSNASSGFYLGAALNWVLDFSPDYGSAYSEPVRRREAPEQPHFKEKTDDGVNQDYFKPVTPLSQDYIQQLQGPKKNLEEATTPDREEMEVKTKAAKKPLPDYKIKLKKAK